MKKRIEKLSEKFNDKMYLSECMPASGDWFGFKYFLYWSRSQTVYKAFKSQKELVEFLQELEENEGLVNVSTSFSSRCIKVFK